MENTNDLVDLMFSGQQFDTLHRALRLRIAFPDGITDRVLLPQRVHGAESMCGGIAYTILCVSASSDLPLKSFIGLAAELQLVTDTGELHGVCGLITEAASGQSDGGLATYQLVLRDAFSSVLALGASTRVFIDKNEIEIAAIVLAGWRARSPLLAAAFDYKFSVELAQQQFPQRAFTRQDNEPDWAFLTRLFKRRGIAWFVRPGRAMPGEDDDDDNGAPVHTLVLFVEQLRLPQNAAGILRYHRADGTEEHDSVTAWRAVRTLGRGSVSRFSWNYDDPLATPFMAAGARSRQDQGQRGNRIAIDINDFRIDPPHAGDTNADHIDLTSARMAAHDYAVKSFHGEGTLRDLRVGEWITLDGHPEIDRHDDEARQFIVTAFQLAARNNLPKALNGRVERLFARSRWHGAQDNGIAELIDTEAQPFRIHFTCSRRSIRIVPPYDARVDVPPARLHSAIVVGPQGETVHCDDLGRIKIRFPGTREADHQHAGGAGASGTDSDSAWVRLAMPWAGNGPGSFNQFGAVFLPRAGSEVLIDYIDSDPDRPVIVGQLYNQAGMPAALSARGALPGNRYLAGLRSREVRGTRGNQLRLDDTPEQISAQLASDHGASALNLGWLSTPRADGAGQPRGEGAELRSDQAVALRARQGIFLTASSSSNAEAAQLERTNLIDSAEAAVSVTQELSESAAAHSVDSADGDQLGELLGAVRNWHSGSNIAPREAQAGGRPIVAASAEAGMLLASTDNLALAAKTRIDIASIADTQLSAGRSLFLRAARGLNLVAFKLGMKLVAAAGNLRIEAHDGDIVITCPKKIRIVAGEGIDIEAQKIKVVAQGVQADFGGGAITQQSSGAHTIKASCFDQLGAGDATPEGVKLPVSSMNHDQQVQLVDMVSCEPASKRKYRITTGDGAVIEGVSDDAGMTERFTDQSAFSPYKIELLD
jgi:type VI secretion system secreted protein VgrG